MQNAIVGILLVIAVTLIGGPVFGGIALLVYLVPGAGKFLAGALLCLVVLLALWSSDGMPDFVKVFLAAGLGYLILRVCIDVIKRAEHTNAPYVDDVLERTLIEGTIDIYQDQNGRKWKKVAGVFEPVNDPWGNAE